VKFHESIFGGGAAVFLADGQTRERN